MVTVQMEFFIQLDKLESQDRSPQMPMFPKFSELASWFDARGLVPTAVHVATTLMNVPHDPNGDHLACAMRTVSKPERCNPYLPCSNTRRTKSMRSRTMDRPQSPNHRICASEVVLHRLARDIGGTQPGRGRRAECIAGISRHDPV